MDDNIQKSRQAIESSLLKQNKAEDKIRFFKTRNDGSNTTIKCNTNFKILK